MNNSKELELHHADLPYAFPGTHLPSKQLRKLVSQGNLVKVRSGIYVEAGYAQGLTGFTGQRMQRLCDISALRWKLKENEVISHQSAAIMWGLRLTVADRDTHVTAYEGRAVARALQHAHQLPIPREQIVELSGVPVTTLERTVVDCARTLAPPLGLVVADHAMALGANKNMCHEINAGMKYANGRSLAARIVDLSIKDSESAPESIVRYLLHDAGITGVEPQFGVIVDGRRYWLDLAIPHLKIAIEYDGRIKYQGASDALYNEKIRQEQLAKAGWLMIRIVAEDLRGPNRLVNRVRHAVGVRQRAFGLLGR